MKRHSPFKNIERDLAKKEPGKKEKPGNPEKEIERKERLKKEEINKTKHKAHHSQTGFPKGKAGSLAVRKGGQR